MNSNEFIKYIKESNLEIEEYKLKELDVYIGAVKELEKLHYELEGSTGPPYLKKFMLIDDYMKILRDLKSCRIGIYYKKINEKIKYLDRLELEKENYKMILKEYEEEIAKNLKLKFYRNKENRICFR